MWLDITEMIANPYEGWKQKKSADKSASVTKLRRGGEEQVWTNNGCVFKLEEEVMLWLKLTPTCLACNEYRTSKEMY